LLRLLTELIGDHVGNQNMWMCGQCCAISMRRHERSTALRWSGCGHGASSASETSSRTGVHRCIAAFCESLWAVSIVDGRWYFATLSRGRPLPPSVTCRAGFGDPVALLEEACNHLGEKLGPKT